MRHFLKFIPVDKREQAEREYVATPAPSAEPRPARPSASRQAKPRSQPSVEPELAGTGLEFGGLVERRHVGRGGHVPEYVEGFTERRGKPAAKVPIAAVKVEAKGVKAKLEASAATDNTSAYLAALDNSALMLADSGIFKNDKLEPEPERSFNPYNRG